MYVLLYVHSPQVRSVRVWRTFREYERRRPRQQRQRQRRRSYRGSTPHTNACIYASACQSVIIVISLWGGGRMCPLRLYDCINGRQAHARTRKTYPENFETSDIERGRGGIFGGRLSGQRQTVEDEGLEARARVVRLIRSIRAYLRVLRVCVCTCTYIRDGNSFDRFRSYSDAVCHALGAHAYLRIYGDVFVISEWQQHCDKERERGRHLKRECG